MLFFYIFPRIAKNVRTAGASPKRRKTGSVQPPPTVHAPTITRCMDARLKAYTSC